MSNLSGAKVMVIDDSNTIRRSAEIFLGQAGCSVILAEDGFDALAKIADHQPDVIFCDIMMPRLDGMETCRRLRQVSQVPIIMLTARDDEVDKLLGLELGADDYLVKPFSMRELAPRMKAILRRTQAFPAFQQPKAPAVLRCGALSLDTGRQ
mgnify:CR=1 FL=1